MDNIVTTPNTFFMDLKTIPKQGVFAIYLSGKLDVYVSYSSNIPQALIRLMSDPRFEGECYLNVIESINDKINLRIRCQYFKDLYSNTGYNVINKRRVATRKVVVRMLEDFRHKPNTKTLFYVNILSKGYKEITVGVFNSIDEVNSFMSLNYSNGVNNIMFADNALTKEYLNVR